MRTLFLHILTLWLMLSSAIVWGQLPNRTRYHLKGQFAGDIGLVAIGAGRDFLRHKLDTDLYLGYLPKSVGGDRILTAALKGAYVPFKALPVGPIGWRPLRTGLQLSYTFGDQYFALEPGDKYPKSYYGFSTALHLYLFLGGEFELGGIGQLERWGLYYEWGTLGEYLISYVQNPDYLSLDKIFHLALGIRYKL